MPRWAAKCRQYWEGDVIDQSAMHASSRYVGLYLWRLMLLRMVSMLASVPSDFLMFSLKTTLARRRSAYCMSVGWSPCRVRAMMTASTPPDCPILDLVLSVNASRCSPWTVASTTSGSSKWISMARTSVKTAPSGAFAICSMRYVECLYLRIWRTRALAPATATSRLWRLAAISAQMPVMSVELITWTARMPRTLYSSRRMATAVMSVSLAKSAD
mmetsp:Transcript_333/g.753  ORF Transcript_333/g.753 Transcript_333/m.753 type:complete len:215 (+) Transcript_333:770-1414(+)